MMNSKEILERSDKMRAIIAGGRNFNDYNLLKTECVNIFKQLKSEGYDTNKAKVEVVSGKANGADTLGEKFQKEFNLLLKGFPANWDMFGKSAGYRRNAEMAKYASEDKSLGILIAFHDGKSKGTGHMTDLANRYGLRVFVVNY